MKYIFMVLLLAGQLFVGTAQAGPTKEKPVRTDLQKLQSAPVTPPPAVTPVAVPKPEPVPEFTCVWKKSTTASFASGISVHVSSMAINVCGCCGPSQIWLPGVAAMTSGQSGSAIVLEDECK